MTKLYSEIIISGRRSAITVEVVKVASRSTSVKVWLLAPKNTQAKVKRGIFTYIIAGK